MYEYIKGTVAEVAPAYAVIDAGGVGYYLHISLETYSAIEHETETRLYVHYVVREDAQLLYGFFDQGRARAVPPADQRLGRGRQHGADDPPSTYSPRELQGIITAGNAVLLKNVKGLGLKTAQKIIVELSGKIMPSGADDGVAQPGAGGSFDEAPCGAGHAGLRPRPGREGSAGRSARISCGSCRGADPNGAEKTLNSLSPACESVTRVVVYRKS